MHPLAEEYLKNRKKSGTADPKEKEIRDFLLSEGLFEIEYSPRDTADAEFPMFDSAKNRPYRLVPIPVTQQEYEELRDAAGKTGDPSSGVQVSGIAVYVIGAIIGVLYLGSGLAPLVWLGTFVSGTILLALAKIIARLHEIGQKENIK